MYAIISFDKNDEQMNQFLSWPLELYKNDPFYIPVGSCLQMTLPARYFMVKQNERIYGRLASIINRDISYQQKKTGILGYYECIDDDQVAHLLLNAGEEYLKEKGFSYCLGPLNGSTWHSYRLTSPDPYPPFFLDNYHKPWYEKQFLSYSYKSIAGYNSSRITKLSVSEDRIKKLENHLSDIGIYIRPINLTKFKEEIEKIYSLCLSSFKNNFLYSPISIQEFSGMYQGIEKYIDPQLVLICEDIQAQPLAFIFCISDYFAKNKKSLVIKTLAVAPKGRGKGLGVHSKITSVSRQ